MERDELIALWFIQYMHQTFAPENMSALFERAFRECVAVNTDRDTDKALRFMLDVARANGYLDEHEWQDLLEIYA